MRRAPWTALLIVVTLTAGLLPTAALAVDAEGSRLAGRAWIDVDADGRRGDGETEAVDLPVMLLARSTPTGPLELRALTRTDANGRYAFEPLAPGEYVVEFRLPPDTAFTYQDVGDKDSRDSDVDRSTGRTEPRQLGEEPIISVDAGVLRTPDLTRIAGWVWEDWDDDGIDDFLDEFALAGVTVRLLRETRAPRRQRGRRGGRQRTTFERVISVTSRQLAEYEFYVPPGGGRYRVEVVPPEGYETVARDQGGDDDLDSDVDPVSRRSDPFTLDEDRFIDIGLAPIGHIGDRTWVDADGDGIQDVDEVSLPGVLVILERFDAAAGAFVLDDMRITDEDGVYSFGPRRPGMYFVRFIPPEDHTFTRFQAGDDTMLDSDAMEDTGATPDILLPEDALPPEVAAFRDLIAAANALRRARQGRGERPAPRGPAGPDIAEVGGAAGGGGPVGAGGERTPFWDAGLIPGDGLPDVIVMPDAPPVVCGTSNRTRDREVTMRSVRAVRLPGGLHAFVVRLARGLKADFSFAVVLHVRTPDGTRSFVWEIHDGEPRIGLIDPQTGEILRAPDEGLRILHDRRLGIVVFIVDGEAIPGDADIAVVQSFHSPTERSMTNCHVTPTFELPQAEDTATE